MADEIARMTHYPNGSMIHSVRVVSMRADGTLLKQNPDGSWVGYGKITKGTSFRKYIHTSSPDECVIRHPDMLNSIPRQHTKHNKED